MERGQQGRKEQRGRGGGSEPRGKRHLLTNDGMMTVSLCLHLFFVEIGVSGVGAR